MKKGAVSNQITFNNKLGGTSPHLPPPPLSVESNSLLMNILVFIHSGSTVRALAFFNL